LTSGNPTSTAPDPLPPIRFEPWQWQQRKSRRPKRAP
jgi:hypothetical protein